jgi:GNAT superfamily N-acetyltransferase
MFDIETYRLTIHVSYADAWVNMSEIHYEGLDGQNYATLYGLRSNERRKGYASKVMDYVCNVADMYNIELSLSAWADDFDNDPPDLLTQDELVAFYERKGFVFDENICKGRRGVRLPKQKPIEYNEQVDGFLKGLHEEYQEELMAVYID